MVLLKNSLVCEFNSGAWDRLPGRRVELLRRTQFACRSQLTLVDHVHELDTGESCHSRTKRSEPQHWPNQLLDGSMVLLDNVVEEFDLTNIDTRLMFRVVAFDRHRVRPTFVNCDLLRCTMLTKCLAQEARCDLTIPLGNQQEVYRGTGRVDGSI
jgi:hypothetical protein